MSTIRHIILTGSICTFLSLVAHHCTAQIKVSYDKEPAKKTEAVKTAFVEHMPEFNGDLVAFLSENLHYPDSARARSQQGRAVVEFIVSEAGLTRDIHVKQSSGFDLLDEEAMRLLRLMQFTPYWKPGTQKGVPVPVIFTLPITFKLD
jgi:protein TonB